MVKWSEAFALLESRSGLDVYAEHDVIHVWVENINDYTKEELAELVKFGFYTNDEETGFLKYV